MSTTKLQPATAQDVVDLAAADLHAMLLARFGVPELPMIDTAHSVVNNPIVSKHAFFPRNEIDRMLTGTEFSRYVLREPLTALCNSIPITAKFYSMHMQLPCGTLEAVNGACCGLPLRLISAYSIESDEALCRLDIRHTNY